MLIIVEGVDGVGKTTFVHDLEKAIHRESEDDEVNVLHRGPPKSTEVLEEYELPLQLYGPGDGKHVICDRWHLGELIYGPLLRGESLLDHARLQHVEMFLHARGALLVNLTAPPEEVRRRRANRDKDDLITDDQIEKIIDGYAEQFYRTDLPCTWVDWRDDKAHRKRWIRMVIHLARDAEASSMWTRSFSTYVGNPKRHGVILCGERRNQNHDDRWLSAFVPVSGSSGHYLLNALTPDVLGVAGLANACEEDVRSLAIMTDAKFVALGAHAASALNQAYVEHGTVPHPQYVRRFHHRASDEYGQVIRRAAFLQEDHLSWRP